LTLPPGATITMTVSMRPSRFKYERECLERGCARIAGADEAGRGPLAGPVVAAVACLPLEWIQNGLPRKLQGLNDSKQLNEAERERFYGFLTTHAEVAWAVASIDVALIDSINILQASLRAMNEALLQLTPLPDHALVDGPHIFSLRCPQTPIIDGDAKSYSIAAASVIAKVTRDRMMADLDKKFPQYGFADHKGYSTARHLEAITRHGPCAIHRLSFSPFRQADPVLFA
jgi:ribonuclease HII